MQSMLKKLLPHLLIIFTFLVICIFKFYPQLEGKQVLQGDIIQFKGMSAEMYQYGKETGEYPAWTNSMFGGMPTYQLGYPAEGNWTNAIRYFFNLGFERPIGYFLTAMISVYILFLVLGAGPLLGALGGIAFSFTTYHFLIFEAGHTSKLYALSFAGLILAGIILAYRKSVWQGALLTAIGIALNVGANHFQMTYYLGIAILFLSIAYAFEAIQKNRIPEFLKISGVLLVAGLIGLSTSATKILPTLEYGKSTMRGEKLLQKKSGEGQSGLEWDYAMTYSQGMADLLTLAIPGFAGGSSGEPVSKDSHFAQEVIKLGASPTNLRAPLYWGSLPGTAGPVYFGAIIFLFAFFGLRRGAGNLKWGLLAGIVITVLISFGNNMESFNKLMFDYFPQFNKFRAVNSVLAITALLSVALAGIGLKSFFDSAIDKEKALKDLKIVGGSILGFILFLTFFGSAFFNLVSPADAQYARSGINPDVFVLDRIALIRSDGFRTFMIMSIVLGALWFYLKGNLKKEITLVIFICVTLYDLLGVGGRYLNNNDFVPNRMIEAPLQPRGVDEQIRKDTDLSFRVFDVSENPFNSSKASLFHHSIGGYHAAKLQRYQDLIDRFISKNHLPVLNMLNTKYFIINDENEQLRVQQNTNALGNVWFVRDVAWSSTSAEELDAMNEFNPAKTAVINREFEHLLGKEKFDDSGKIEMESYHPEKLVYRSESTEEGLAVFSEIWYGPELGWKLYINDVEVPLIRADYVLRAAKIPAGSNSIVMKFEPQVIKTGRSISLVSSILVLMGLLGGLIYVVKNNLKREEA